MRTRASVWFDFVSPNLKPNKNENPMAACKIMKLNDGNGCTTDQNSNDECIVENGDIAMDDSSNVSSSDYFDLLVGRLYEGLSSLTLLHHLHHFFEKILPSYLDKLDDLEIYFNCDAIFCQYYFKVLTEAIVKPMVFKNYDMFNNSFGKYQKHYLDYSYKIDKSLYQDCDAGSKTSERRLKLLETIIEMSQKMSESLAQIQEDNNYSLTTAPIALKTLLVVQMVLFSFKKALPLLEQIFKILWDRKDRRLPCDNHYWADLKEKAQRCIWIDGIIANLEKKRSEDVAHLTLFLVTIGIESDPFDNLLARQSVKELATSLQINMLDLFLDFQKEISLTLIEKLSQNFDLALLYRCMKIFAYKSLPDELVRWILPVFVVQCNDYSRQLLENVLQDHRNSASKTDLIKQYLKYILMHLFYDCQATVQQIHQVLKFLSEYCQQDIFGLVNRLNKHLVDAFLLNISKNRDMTLRALSLIVMASNVEPEQLPETMLRFDLETFNQNETKFLIFLQQKCQIFFHSLSRLLDKNNTFAEKMTLIDSFGIILRHLDVAGINKHRIIIYFIIRQILTEPYQSAYVNLLQTGLAILDHFIERLEETFFHHQLLSIFLLVLPLAKRSPKEVYTLLFKLLTRHQYRPSTYYQLRFLLQESSSTLKPINEFINQKLNQLVSNTLTDTKDNPRTDENQPRESGTSGISVVHQEIGLQTAEMVAYVKSADFLLRCQEIHGLMENIETWNEKLQEMILRQLYSRLEWHREAFYRISVQRSPHLAELLATIEIELDESNRLTLADFIGQIYLRLFGCIKFSTCIQVRKLAGNCLGLLGAINVEFLRFDRPFLLPSVSSSGVTKSIDFCNQTLFQPKKKAFKLLVLDILMNMVPMCRKLSDHMCINYALKETLAAFTHDTNVTPLLAGNEDDSDLVSTQQIDQFVQKHYGKQTATTRGTSSQEVEQLQKSDQIKTYLRNEKDEVLDLDQDLEGELRFYRYELESSSYNKKYATRKQPSAAMEQFFDSVRPSMPYQYFVQYFIRMLYCFGDSTTDSIGSSSSGVTADNLTPELVENLLLQSAAVAVATQSAGGRSPIMISEKLSQLATPAHIFSVCRSAIQRNFKLAHVLLPALIVVSLGRTTGSIREEFAARFQRMVRQRFIENAAMFRHELGAMGSELLCYIYDYLRTWFNDRQLAHQVIILTQTYDSKCKVTIGKQMDQEYHGVKLILDAIDDITMARLAYRAGAFCRALHYLERNFDERRKSKITALPPQEHVAQYRPLYLNIYHGLGELASIRGLASIGHANPSVNHLFHQYLLEPDPVGQLICGAELISSRPKVTEDGFDLEEKYLHAMLNLNQYPPPSCETAKLAHYKLESAWRLNSWDLIDSAMSATGANTGDNDVSDLQGVPSFGRILWAMHRKETPMAVENILDDVQQGFLAPLNAALLANTNTAYGRTYAATMVALHILHDVRQFISIVYTPFLSGGSNQRLDEPSSSDFANQILESFRKLVQNWRKRNQLLPDGLTRQPVLDVQRSLIDVMERHHTGSNVQAEMFHYWQQSIRSYVDAGCMDRAHIPLLKASQHRLLSFEVSQPELLDFVLDSAKVFWAKNDHTQSIRLLSQEMEQHYDDIRKYCYTETLQSFANVPEPDAANLAKWLRIDLPAKRKGSLAGLNGAATNLSGGFPVSYDHAAMVELFQPGRLDNFGRLQLLHAQYCEQSRCINSIALKVLYKAATVACPNWEESHFHMAMFYRRLYQEYQNSSQLLQTKTDFNLGKPQEIAELKSLVIQSLCRSLQFGTLNYVRVSLSTLLNIWVDLGYEHLNYKRKQSRSGGSGRASLTTENTYKDDLARIVDATIKHVRRMSTTVNDAIFMVELDMLIAHMLHPVPGISQLIQEILVQMIIAFPHHMVWFLSRPMNTPRLGPKITELVRLANTKNKNPTVQIGTYFEKFRHLSQSIIGLAQFRPRSNASNAPRPEAGVTRHVPLRIVSPLLVRTIQNDSVRFMLPCNQICLPNTLNLERFVQKTSFEQHFRGSFIENVEDQIAVMHSLQKPKKMTFICHDGSKRTVLVKDHDDLRKDRAFLNFANTFNQCYRGEIKSGESMSQIDLKYDMATEMKIRARWRKQPLAVQTYIAMPLTNSCGMIEWVPGLQSLKTLVEGQYMKTRAQARSFIFAKNAFMKSAANTLLSRDKRIERFQAFYPMFQPPVFQNWFHETYPDSYSWYLARRNFTRTSSVFSIIGYIMGLGDRHAENIMVEPATGQVVQVDFNCLFNQGESFQVPECVPFRLTQNMIAAMGTLGFEGMFRHTCEDVLLVLRHFRQLFVNLINVFLYDAFDDWISDRSGDRASDIAQKSVFNVEARLFGIAGRTDRKMPRGNILSIEGQVDCLIKDATDIQNIGSMYHGWASYL